MITIDDHHEEKTGNMNKLIKEKRTLENTIYLI
jgi:hypothetical protein